MTGVQTCALPISIHPNIPKLVWIEEADYLSPNAQAILRKFMEEFNDQCRFILTCNYENKIIPAIKSRTQQFRFEQSDKDEIALFAANILIKEEVAFDINLLDSYISVGYPDIRKIIQLLQQNTINKVLQPFCAENEAGDYKFKLLNMITNDDWLSARSLICANVTQDGWDSLYRFLYENLSKSKKFTDQNKWQAGQLAIASYLHKHALVSDPEINASAMFISLSQL